MREWLKQAVQDAVKDIGAELKERGSHGSHEAAACLFNGSAFVMYPRGTRDDATHQPEPPQIEHGREM